MKTILINANLFKINDNTYQVKSILSKLPFIGHYFTKTFTTNNLQLKYFLLHPDSGVGDNKTEFLVRVTDFGLGKVVTVNKIPVLVNDTDAFFGDATVRDKNTAQIFTGQEKSDK